MGTDHSGEDIESGRVNRADDRTIIWGQNGDDGVDFNGPAIFMVERAGDPVEDVDYSEPDGWVPDRALDAILGIGSSGRNIGTTVGGIGVTGRGGERQGTGVLGIGGSAGNDGGIGAHGVGGAGPHGSGLVGQGGRRDLAGRDPYGTGVVGVGGGADRPLPPSTDTAGAGVFGRGADVVTADLHGDPVGPEAPGAGVSGRGGVMDSPRPLNAAGVIGVAGGYPNPAPADTFDTGVHGTGSVGVSGHGLQVGVNGTADSGPGVHGYSPTGPGVDGYSERSRGGRFSSDSQAQVQLVPVRARDPLPEGRRGAPLPRDGVGGDLMALVDGQGQCTLWFCVRSAESGAPARWAQVQLGTPFDGTL
jgi:hypothetical protein